MKNKLTELIRYGSESHSLDFKARQYPMETHDKKNEFLKDISAMANHLSDEDKYIVIGVGDVNGDSRKFYNVTDLVDDSKYQQFINSNIDPPINFEYQAFNFDGKQLAYFRIFNNTNRPYLFKKDLVNPIKIDKNEFRIGDGYIRQGSSTRKMTREDFDSIYKSRFHGRDRKGDLKVSSHIFGSNDDEIKFLGHSFLDVDIENVSSKSIDFDVEIAVIKTGEFKIVQLCDLKNAIQDKRKMEYPYGMPVARHYSIDVDLQQSASHFLIRRAKRTGERTAISIPQHDKVHNLFCKELIIVCTTTVVIKGTITIRSDDFSEGSLVQPFVLTHTGGH